MKLKHLPILLCLTLCISVATAQKPEKVKTKTEKCRDGISKIKYQVLRSDKKIKHGFYKQFNTYYNQLVVSGTYKYGKKDGLWEEWITNSDNLKSKGYYKNGIKVGVWEYMDFLKRPLHTYNHDTNTLIFDSSCGKNYPRNILLNGKKVYKELDCVPSLLGGTYSLSNDLYFSYLLTNSNDENTSAFNVDISILINKDGDVVEIEANGANLSKEFYAILEKKINNPEFVWLPGKLNGKKVDAYVVLKFVVSSYQTSD